jgi:hypothetical protein
MSEGHPEFTPEEIALGEKVTAYYMRDDLPQPDDDETKRPSPFKEPKDQANQPAEE